MEHFNQPKEGADLPVDAVEGTEPMKDAKVNKGLTGAIARMRAAMTGSKE